MTDAEKIALILSLLRHEGIWVGLNDFQEKILPYLREERIGFRAEYETEYLAHHCWDQMRPRHTGRVYLRHYQKSNPE